MAGIDPRLREQLKKQQYEFCGEHSAVKVCNWTKKSLRDEGACYKQQFYGIRSHLCCQMTPTVGYCQNRCVFCWREMEYTAGAQMEEPVDDPEGIVDQCIGGQRTLLSGFGGNPSVNMDKLREAQEPMHFAISLTGEPTTYPRLNELIRILHGKGKTTFVVSNGMLPEHIRAIEPPTQLYLSLDAPNEELHRKIDQPVLDDAWNRMLSSLDALRALKERTRTTLRITLIKGMNMCNPEEWAELIRRADPLFVEVKAYMFVGSSRLRLTIENMPRHYEVMPFAESVASAAGYQVIDENEGSRVALLARHDFEGRVMQFTDQ